MDEREAYIALNMMEHVGPVGVCSLVSTLGCAIRVFDAGARELRVARGVGTEVAESIIRQRDELDWQAEPGRAEAIGARIVTQIDDEYPKDLLQIHDPPLALYVRGRLECRDRNAIAVVGTRRPTHYGRDCAEKFAYQLGKRGLVVVSGLAAGIDMVAHQGALKAGGRTLAVLGSGLDYIYPASNAELAEDIAARGALISEFPLGRRPDKTTFPMRNRIVSGMSMGVLIIEAGHRSGALITASLALEQGRAVFAVPGRVDSRASVGCHELIRNGACLTRQVDDILDELDLLLPRERTPMGAPTRARPPLTEGESRVFDLLESGSRDVDSLIRTTGMRPGEVSSVLIGLEMKRVVRMLPGRMVERVDV